MQRSTKGASKQRRDWINTEINEIKECLPVTEAVRRRLSQLQVMALCNSYINKSNCFQNALSVNDCENSASKCIFDFSEALPGFLLATTTDGKLLYISENVTEYLGHSMVELMTQADSVYDIIDRVDHTVLRTFLMSAKCDTMKDGLLDELDFICRMNLGRLFRRISTFDKQKSIKVHGRLIWPEGSLNLSEPIFVARCTPVLSCLPTEQAPIMDTMMFHSSHSTDMKFLNIQQNGEFHWGYTRDELMQQSWYQYIHPEDIAEASRKHTELIGSGIDATKSLCVRVQTKYGHFMWVHIVMRLGSSPLCPENVLQEIVCLNHVISEQEALETRNREANEQLMLVHVQDYACGLNQIRGDVYNLPTVVVEEGFFDQSSSEEFIRPVDCNRPELMKKLRYKVQEKQSKRARFEFCPSPPGVVDSVQTMSNKQMTEISQVSYPEPIPMPNPNNLFPTSQYSSQNFDALRAPKCYNVLSPLTPPYSDDGNSVDCSGMPFNSSSIPDRSAAVYTPPYSPPNCFSHLDETPSPNLDEASIFESMYPISRPNTYCLVVPTQKVGQQLLEDELPELGGTVEMFFQEEESKDFLMKILPTNNNSTVHTSGKNAQFSDNFMWASQIEFLQPGSLEIGDKSEALNMNQCIEYNDLHLSNGMVSMNEGSSLLELIESQSLFEAFDSMSSFGQLLHA